MNRIDAELVALRRLAEELSRARKERPTTAHVLAAMAARPSAAAELLVERGLDCDGLLRAARVATDDLEDAIGRASQAAGEIAARTSAGLAPNAVHLLIAMLNEPRSAAHRVLSQCGVNVSRLRVAAMNRALGHVGRRRVVKRGAEPEPATAALASRDAGAMVGRSPTSPRPRSPGVAISLFPPPRPAPRVEPPPPPPEPPPPAEAAVSAPAAAPEPPLVEAEKETPEEARPRRRLRAKAGAAVEGFALDPQRFPMLNALGNNLTLAAARGELDPVVGRDIEIEQALDVLAKRQGNNPCLVGAAGVGKTSVVRGIARRIASADGVASLDDRIVVEIPVGELVAGTGVRGALAQRVTGLRKEVLSAQGRVVLFFDEIHQLFGGDAAEEIAGELKIALAKGEMPCIGTSTVEEYRKTIDSDPALARRFTLVEVDEPCREDAFLVLEALASGLERHHKVRYDEQALALAVAWSVRYLPGRALPDKAVAIVDLAGARTRRRGGDEVGPQAVAEVVAELADMPVERLLETDRDRMLRLESLLAERVVGHSEQIARIARILRRNAAGLGSRRPIGTFLLLGPTGVGKTETAKAVAETLFNTETAMTRVDLSEFSEAHAVARLIGAPPGYVGHEAGGQLTEAVRRRPYQVVLLDEIEKAHPEVLQTFLGVFDEGRLTDGKGRTVDFTNTVIVLTSNLGASETGSSPRRRVGFGADAGPERSELEARVVSVVRAALPPELYNRLDEVLVFAPLGRDEVRLIAERLLAGIGRALEERRGVALRVEPAAVDLLLDAGGYDPTLGARPMRRTIARLVEAPLAEKILSGDLAPGDVALVTREGDGLTIRVQPAAESMRAPAAE